MLVPLLQHLSFTRLKIYSLLHMSEIYRQPDMTFAITQLILRSTRSVPIEIQSSSILSPNQSIISREIVKNDQDDPNDQT